MKSQTAVTPQDEAFLPPGRVWPRFLLFPGLAMLSYLMLALDAIPGVAWIQGLWLLGASYFWFCIGGVFHEMAHQTLEQNPRPSIWAGRIIGTFLVIPYTAYRETHIRHHAYLNTPHDWELWPYSDPAASLWFRRAFVWFDLLLAMAAGPIIYGRIYYHQNSPLGPRIRRQILCEYLASAGFWGTITATVGWLTSRGTIRLGQLPLWVAPLLIAASCNTFRKFTEHLGMASYDPILGTRTVVGGNVLTRLCSYFNFEIFVHGPHHRYPRTPHDRLEARLTDYRRERPGVAVPMFTSYRAAFWAALPWLLQNPGVGVNVGGAAVLRHRPGIDRFVTDVAAEVLCADPAESSAASRRVA